MDLDCLLGRGPEDTVVWLPWLLARALLSVAFCFYIWCWSFLLQISCFILQAPLNSTVVRVDTLLGLRSLIMLAPFPRIVPCFADPILFGW